MKYFPGDDNQLLKDIQEETFYQIGSNLFYIPAYRYKRAAELLQVSTEILSEINKRIWGGFNYSIYKEPYDFMAAFFRYSHNPHWQLLLPFNDSLSIEEESTKSWISFFKLETEAMAENDICAILLINILVFMNEKEGKLALENLMFQFKEKYPMPPDRYIKR
jgi:hypothetical protein